MSLQSTPPLRLPSQVEEPSNHWVNWEEIGERAIRLDEADILASIKLDYLAM